MSVFEVTVDPTFGVEATIELVIDTTNTDDITGSVSSFEDLYTNDWSVSSESKAKSM